MPTYVKAKSVLSPRKASSCQAAFSGEFGGQIRKTHFPTVSRPRRNDFWLRRRKSQNLPSAWRRDRMGMKASLKLREDRNPLLRAKFPVGILGFPFVSGVAGGDPGDLSFSIQTAWIPSLSLKLSYRPNDAHKPFVFAVKSGIGPLNSREKSSVMVIAAEFSVLRKGTPCFFLQIKPELGDFLAKKSVASHSSDGNLSLLTGDIETVNAKENAGFQPFRNGLTEDISVENLLQFKDSPTYSAVAAGIREMFSGTAIAARTRLPVRKNVVLKVRWGVNLPLHAQSTSGGLRASFVGASFPFLTVDKISVENVEPAGVPHERTLQKEVTSSECGLPNEVLKTMKEELESLQRENNLVRESIRELKSAIGKGNGRLPGIEYPNLDDNVKKKRSSADNSIHERKLSEYSGRSRNSSTTVADVSEELKKAIRGAPGV